MAKLAEIGSPAIIACWWHIARMALRYGEHIHSISTAYGRLNHSIVTASLNKLEELQLIKILKVTNISNHIISNHIVPEVSLVGLETNNQLNTGSEHKNIATPNPDSFFDQEYHLIGENLKKLGPAFRRHQKNIYAIFKTNEEFLNWVDQVKSTETWKDFDANRQLQYIGAAIKNLIEDFHG